MKNKAGLTALLLTLALLLCLLPVSALAAGAGTGDAEAEPAASAAPETPEPADSRSAAAIVAQGETAYAAADSVLFNNGGTVFNNGGIVYNNQGTVYNNEGTTYNNEGTVYANGGTVYNNAGTVYDNGARIVSHNGESQSGAPEGFHQVRFAADYSAFAGTEGLEEAETGLLLAEEKSCVISPKEGFQITAAETTAGTLEAQKDGSYILSGLEDDAELTLSFKPDAPVFSLAPGSYTESQYVELTAPEGTIIYFTDDGSEPVVGKGRYAGAISIRKGAVIKAIAAAEGSEISDLAEASYAVLKVEGPVYETAHKGYRTQELPIRVSNQGEADGAVASVRLSGENAKQFYLSHSSGRTIEAGEEISDYWTVQPLEGLEPGTYTALASVELDGGETVELELSFTVEE